MNFNLNFQFLSFQSEEKHELKRRKVTDEGYEFVFSVKGTVQEDGEWYGECQWKPSYMSMKNIDVDRAKMKVVDKPTSGIPLIREGRVESQKKANRGKRIYICSFCGCRSGEGRKDNMMKHMNRTGAGDPRCPARREKEPDFSKIIQPNWIKEN